MKNVSESCSRTMAIDILKFVAIFLVLLGHSIQLFYGDAQFYDDKLYTLIMSFHMPLFIVISGYLFFFSRGRKTIAGLFTRIFRMLLSLIIWGSVVYLIQLKITHTLLPLSYILTVYWFVMCYIQIVAVGGVLLLIFERGNCVCRGVAFLIGGVILAFSPLLPDMNLYLYPFFITGYIFGRYKENILKFYIKRRLPATIVMILIYGAALYLYDTYDCFISKGIFPNDGQSITYQFFIDAVRMISGILGSALIVVVVFELSSKHSESRSLKTISEIGKHTLEIYYLQKIYLETGLYNIFREVTGGYSYTNFTQHISYVEFIISPFCAMAILIICLTTIKVLEKAGVKKILFQR